MGTLRRFEEKGLKVGSGGIVPKLWTTPTKIFLAPQVNFHHGKVHQHILFQIPSKQAWAFYMNLWKLTLF